MAAIKEVKVQDHSYIALMASEEYLKKAKSLNKVEADRLLSKMRGNPLGKLENENFNPLESLAIQLELEDQQLSEWRKNMHAIREN
ncbi:hypothetical protein MCEREM3_00139 [Methylophilaceae bacterium]